MIWTLLTLLSPAQAQTCGTLGATWTASFDDTEVTITDDTGTSHTLAYAAAPGDFIIIVTDEEGTRVEDVDPGLLDVLDASIRLACDDGILEIVWEQGHGRTIQGDNGQEFIIIEVLEED